MTSKPFKLRLQNGLNIDSSLTQKEAEQFSINTRDMETGYIWCDFEEQELDGIAFVVSVCFYNSRIESLTVCLTDKKYGSSWDDWDEEKEKRRAKDIQDFLKSLNYPTGTYSWGKVWAAYDSKAGQGIGGIRYEKRKKHSF